MNDVSLPPPFTPQQLVASTAVRPRNKNATSFARNIAKLLVWRKLILTDAILLLSGWDTTKLAKTPFMKFSVFYENATIGLTIHFADAAIHQLNCATYHPS